MAACTPRLFAFGIAILLIVSSITPAADPPADPLPKSAKLRLGTTRLRSANSWNGAALSADGKHLVAPGATGLTKYDVATGDESGVLGPRPMTFAIGGRIELTRDGNRGLNSGYNVAIVWDVKTGKVLAEVKRPMPFGESPAAISADGAVVAVGGVGDTKDKGKPVTAIVWDVDRNARRVEVSVLQNQSASVAVSPDGKILATWGTHYEPNPPPEGVNPATDPNRIVQFWDAVSGKELSKVRSDGFGSTVVAFTPDGQSAALSHGAGAIRLVDPKTGAEKRRLFGRSNQGFRLAISPDGKSLAAAGSDGTVQLWNLTDGSRQGLTDCPLGPLPAAPREVRFTPTGLVAWATAGSAAIVWEVPSGKLLSPAGGHFNTVQSVFFAEGGKALLTGGSDGQILRWDAATGKQTGEVRLRLPAGFGEVFRLSMREVELTSDGKQAILAKGSAGIFDVSSGQQLAAPSTVLGYETRPHLCSDARTLLAVPVVPFQPKELPKSLAVDVWDVQSGSKSAVLEFPVGDLSAAAVAPDRSKLITGVSTRANESGKNAFILTSWDLATGKKIGEESLPGGFGSAFITASPDNKSALVSTLEGKLVLFDAAGGKIVKEIDTGRQRLSSAPAFSADGRRFAAPFSAGFGLSATATVRLYDAASGEALREFRGHSSFITCMAFSPDGKTLATGSQDTTVLLWDLDSK